MFVKITTSGPRRYVQLVESYRDEAGRVKKRTVATLGRLDQLTGELDAVIDGLLKVSGREPVAPKVAAPASILASSLSFEAARALGNVWALTELWKELGFSDLRRVFRPTRHTIDVHAFVPLKFDLGEAFQFDWSEAGLVVGGIYRRIEVSHMKLRASRAFWLVAYPSQGHEMLFDAHTRSFAALGGVSRRGIYDLHVDRRGEGQKGQGPRCQRPLCVMCAHSPV